MSLSQMQVFNQYILPATIETLAQMIGAFNAASGGAIRLSTEGFDGDFLQESFFAAINGAQRRVNRYSQNGAAPVTDLTQLKHSTVKVAGGFGPIRFEPSQLTWLNQPTVQGVEVASRNFAQNLLQDQLNTSIAALCAAIGAQALATNDVSATAGMDYVPINAAHGLFGDASSALITQVMTGMMYHKLIGKNLTNANRLFQAGSVLVVDLLGKLVVVTDAPALYEAAGGSGDGPLDRVLSLTDSAAVVSDSGDIVTNIETTNGNQRIETTMQVDYSFGLSLKGYTWDEVNGGKSPTDAALSSGANWVKVASSIKNTAGVLTVADASK